MDIRRLKVFVAVAKAGNMTAAAGRLFISQPTVSQIVSELEDHYKTKLFERYPKRLCLTESGKNLLYHAEKLIEEFEGLEQMMKDGGGRELLRVGATVTVGSTVISPLLGELKQDNPFLDIYVFIDNTRTIEQKLLDNQLDIALVEADMKSPIIVSETVIDDCLILVCGAQHHLSGRDSITLGELSNEFFIMREEGSGTRDLFESVMRRRNIMYNVGWESSSPESIKQAVIKNHGLAVISARLVAKELSSGDICFIPVSDCMWKRHFNLTWHRDKHISQPMSMFINLARTYEKYGLSCPVSKSEIVSLIESFHQIE